MFKNKKTIIIIAIICVIAIGVGAFLIFKTDDSKKPNDNNQTTVPKVTEAPQLREELPTFDYIEPEELEKYPVHDMQDYITYDYASIANNKQAPLFVSDYYNELLKNPEKHNSCEISQDKIDEFIKHHEIPVDKNGNYDPNDYGFEMLFTEKHIDHNIKNFDDSEFTIFDLQCETHTMYSNEVHLAFHKNAFEDYKQYYKVSYDLFIDIIKEFEPETIVSCLLPKIENTTMETIEKKVLEKDYDYLFNAIMNGCFEFRYMDENSDISFGIQTSLMEDETEEPFFYVNIIRYFTEIPEYAQ